MIKVRIKKLPKARTGYQVQGALVNDVPAMGGADYNAYIGAPKLRESKYIKAVPRDEANLEAEGGETVYGDINGDGMPEHKIIVGPRHAQGGVPLNLPEDTFIFSDTRAMRIKDPELLNMFGKGGTNKSYTPAELAKQYDVQKYRKILEDPETDAIERKTAELMIKKYVVKLGCLALAQESMKGFPQGIPAVAKPCMDARGLTEQDILPNKEISVLNDQLKKQMEQEGDADENMLQQAEEMNDGNPVAQPQEMGPPQEEMEAPSPEEMMMYGGYRRRLRRAQEGMQQPSPEEMAMMQQQQQGGQDEMGEIMQEVAAALKRGADPSEVVMSLLQNNIPPDAIVQIFTQLGAEPQQAAQIVQQVMTQAQGGGQEQMMQQQPRVPESMSSMQGGGFTPNWTISDPNNVIPKIDPKTNWVTRPSFINKSEDNSLDAILMRQLENPEGLPQLTPEMIQRLTEEAPAEPIQIPQQQYGGYMELGGYDMPFYDMPEAAYGMAMGSGQSQNYQGRPKRIPGSGPMFPLTKAQNGITIDASNMTEEQLQRAIWDAQQKDKNVQIKVVRKDPTTGKIKEQKLKTSGFTVPKGDDITDLKGFPSTSAGRVAAAQYLLIEENLNNPTVRAEIIKNTKESLENPDAWTGKTGTRDPNNTWSKKYGDLPSDGEIIKQALNHQKRNLMFEANEIDPQLFSDVGDKLDNVDTVISKGYVNPKTGQKYTRAEAEAALKSLNDKGFTNVANMSQILGVPLDPSGKDRVLQQGTMHGYAKAYQNFSSGAYDSNPDAKYAMDNFLGNVSLVHSGADDETSMGALYGAIGNRISPLDDKYDYSNANWYQKNSGRLVKGKFTTYGDTTAGHKYMVGKRNLEFEDIPESGPCQCEKDKLPDGSPDPSYKPKDAQGNCTCDPPKPKDCPCQKSDGTVINMTANADGTCPPCTEPKDIPVPGPPAEWWLQDTIKTTGAFGDLMGVKKYMPWAAPAKLQTPRPTFLDPTRELAANAEQANIQTAGMAQFAGPQALSARSSSVQGQASKNAADVLSKYNNANVNIANQFEMKATDIRNQESMLNQATQQRLYDQNTIANQQFDNAKLAMRNNLRNYYTNAITNRWKTDALNQMFPNYQVSPGVGGQMYYQPTEKTTNPSQTSGKTKEEWFKWCKDNGDPNPSACANRMMSGNNSNSTSGADPNMVNTMHGTVSKYGGEMFEDGGFVYIDSWLPFIM